MKKLKPIICKTCQKSFKPDLSIRIYCSVKCASADNPCTQKGDKHPRWKGGIHRRKTGAKRNQPSGYIEIWNGKRWIGEHRLKMQNKIGRKLKTTEHVHHKNGIRNDNRLKNLVVLTHAAHNSLEKPKQVKNWERDKLGRWVKKV